MLIQFGESRGIAALHDVNGFSKLSLEIQFFMIHCEVSPPCSVSLSSSLTHTHHNYTYLLLHCELVSDNQVNVFNKHTGQMLI